MAQIDEIIIAYNTSDDPGSGSGGETSYGLFEGIGNSGMIILDTTRALQSISYLQNVDLLNEEKERLEEMIHEVYCDHNYYRPRMYRENVRKDYLNLAKSKNRTAKKTRKEIKQQLQNIRRNIVYVEAFLSDGVELTPERTKRLSMFYQVYEQ